MFLELLLLTYFIFVSCYAFTLSVAASFVKTKIIHPASQFAHIVVLIPSYKEDGVIVEVAKQALKQSYPSDKFEVVVIADSLKQETITALRQLAITLIEVSFEKSTKVKALNFAMNKLSATYDLAIILDADNVMKDDFVSRINGFYQEGLKAIQGKRAPKNNDTPMAFLDGLSETINNYIYRQGTVAMGGACSLSGSGMAFYYPVLKSTLANMDSVGGFDRELELKLLEQGIKIHYDKDTIVYDEKVPNSQVFGNQRRRWFYSQFFYLKKYFAKGIAKGLQGDFAYLNSSVLRNIQLPRLINLGLLSITTFLSILFSSYFHYSHLWIWLWLMFILSMVFAIPLSSYNKQFFKSLALIPVIFIKMVGLLFKMKGANKSFIHTPHSTTTVKLDENKPTQ